MPRVLHLLEHPADFQTQRLAAALTGDAVTSIGPGGAHRDIVTAVRRLRQQTNRFDLIHAWGAKPLIAAATADIAPIISTPPSPIRRCDIQWLSRISRRREIEIVCSTAAARTALFKAGLPLDKCHLIPPGLPPIAPSPGAPSSPGEIRRRLGLAEDDFVLLAPGETTRAAGHRLSLWATAILHELSPAWKLLVWGRGPLAVDLDNTALRMGYGELVHFGPDEEFESLLSVADIALITADPDAAPLPIALCMAAPLPIVATLFDGLTDRQNALLAPDRSPRTLAQNLLELRADADLRTKLASAARATADHLFNLENFHRAHASLYERSERRGLGTQG